MLTIHTLFVILSQRLHILFLKKYNVYNNLKLGLFSIKHLKSDRFVLPIFVFINHVGITYSVVIQLNPITDLSDSPTVCNSKSTYGVRFFSAIVTART